MNTPGADTGRRWFDGRLFSPVLLVVALFWLGKLTWENLDQLAATAGEFSYANFLGAFVLATASLFTASVTHCLILTETSGRAVSLSFCIPCYLLSQIVRYIPGKIWGILYQTRQLASHVDSREVWAANIVQFAVGIAASVIAFLWAVSLVLIDTRMAIATLALLAGVLYLSLQRKWFHHAVRRLTPKVFRTAPPHHPDRSAEIFLSLLIEWAMYLLSWMILLHGTHSLEDATLLSILYVASWILGFAVTVAPGGLGIRESAFLSLGATFGFNPGTLAFYALLARLLFTLADLVNAALSYAFTKAHQGDT